MLSADGFVENLTSGGGEPSRDDYGVRGQLAFDVTDDLTATVKAELSQFDKEGRNLEVFNERPAVAGPFTGLTYSQILADPHIKARNMVVEVEHPVMGRMKMLGLPVKFTGELAAIRQPAPWLGQHSAETARELGFTDRAIEALFADGVIYDRLREKKPGSALSGAERSQAV